ncbi:DUF3299 domain-containing protein [Endothiovibrio diazotrophicus]
MKPLFWLLIVALAAPTAHALSVPEKGATDAPPAEPTAAATAKEAPEEKADPWAKKLKHGVLELAWDDLVPADFNPEQAFADLNVDDLPDDDPRVEAAYAKMRKMWNHAPVVKALDGRRVRLPGFVVPLEGDGRKVREFLLVPYFGACIHVPPPPSNQIVYVKADTLGAKVRQMFDTVWVTGKLSAESFSAEVGSASYTLRAEKVEPYEE